MPAYAAAGWPPNYASCIHRYGRCVFYGECDEACAAPAVPATDESAEQEDFAAIWEV